VRRCVGSRNLKNGEAIAGVGPKRHKKKVSIDVSPMTATLQKPKHVSKVNVNKERLLTFNPLNAELNRSCHLLALLAHHILHVNRIRVKNRASYIYRTGVPLPSRCCI